MKPNTLDQQNFQFKLSDRFAVASLMMNKLFYIDNYVNMHSNIIYIYIFTSYMNFDQSKSSSSSLSSNRSVAADLKDGRCSLGGD